MVFRHYARSSIFATFARAGAYFGNAARYYRFHFSFSLADGDFRHGDYYFGHTCWCDMPSRLPTKYAFTLRTMSFRRLRAYFAAYITSAFRLRIFALFSLFYDAFDIYIIALMLPRLRLPMPIFHYRRALPFFRLSLRPPHLRSSAPGLPAWPHYRRSKLVAFIIKITVPPFRERIKYLFLY